MGAPRWYEIHRLIELVIDFADGRTVLRSVSRLNWQWRTVYLDWPDPELWRRILNSVHRPAAVQWRLLQRFAPEVANTLSPLSIRHVNPPKNDAECVIDVCFVTACFQVVVVVTRVPLVTGVSTLVLAATEAPANTRVVYCGQSQSGEGTLADLRAGARKRCARGVVILTLSDFRVEKDDDAKTSTVPFASLRTRKEAHSDPTAQDT